MNANDRFAQLERKIRIQSRCLVAMGLVLGAGLCSSALAPQEIEQDEVADTLRARRVEVMDRNGKVIVEIGDEGFESASGAIYLYNDDEVPSGEVRIPSASLTCDDGGQLDLYGHRGDGAATISVENSGSQGGYGRITLSNEDANPYFSVSGGMSGSQVLLFNSANDGSIILRSGSSTPVEVDGVNGEQLFELLEPYKNEGAINLYKDGKSTRLK